MTLLRQAFLSCVCVCVWAKGVVKVLQPNLSQSQRSNPPQRMLPPAEKRWGEPNNQLPEYTRKHNTHEPVSLSSEMRLFSPFTYTRCPDTEAVLTAD